tara:strand:- start:518 stop:661 length:144 start_codon:yes stop_codon:yes gene_type:complete
MNTPANPGGAFFVDVGLIKTISLLQGVGNHKKTPHFQDVTRKPPNCP